MPDEPTLDDDTKAKLKQIRTNYTRSQTIISELETYYTSFEAVRTQLDDKDDGLETNLRWSKEKKEEVDALVVAATAKVAELEAISASTKALADQVQLQYDSFLPLAAKVADPSTGIEAILTLATKLKDDIAGYVDLATTDLTSAGNSLSDILAKNIEVEKAYAEFIELKKSIDDPETGVKAQVAEISQYAKDALKAKTSAESDLISVAQAKENANEYSDAIKVTKEEVDALKIESEDLTDNIRNALGMASAHSLSTEIETQRKKLDGAVRLWTFAVAIAVILFALALGAIFSTLFLDKTSRDYIRVVNGSSILLTVASKALFTSPFIFALFFTTSNFSKTREYRDRYVAKEIAAKNLQAYVKLLRDEFPDNSKERLDFALHNMQAIYNDPAPSKKRSYNFGINKIFQFGIQEEDTQHIKDKLIESAEEVIDQGKSAS